LNLLLGASGILAAPRLRNVGSVDANDRVARGATDRALRNARWTALRLLGDGQQAAMRGPALGMKKARRLLPTGAGGTLTMKDVVDLRRRAHEMGYPSIALAQAFQFDCGLRQKDLIGAWVPRAELDTLAEFVDGDMAWVRGLRWRLGRQLGGSGRRRCRTDWIGERCGPRRFAFGIRALEFV
jgi:hypothetical protein